VIGLGDLIVNLFNAAFTVWNKLIECSITMFSDSPKTISGGALYSTAETIYNAISDVTVPLATLFFIIAIYKSICSTPPEQQARKFLLDMLKYILILYISTHLWDIMGYVVDFSDGITSSVAGSLDSCQVTEDETLTNTILGVDMEDDLDFFDDPGAYIMGFLSFVLTIMVYFIGGIVSIFILGAAGVTVIGVAFQRIIKPLIIMPFGAIVMGIGACSGEGERMLWHYGKAFLAFCISGAFMVVAIKIGNSLITEYEIPMDDVTDGTIKAILLIIKVDMSAIIITGLLKSMDGIVSKVFG